MKLVLKGHDRYYALEQSLLNYFPSEPDGEAVSALSEGRVWTTAVTVIRLRGRRAEGRARVKSGAGENIDNLLKMSFFRAARELADDPHPWGALTGIRPAKKALELMDGPAAGDTGRAAELLTSKYSVTPERAGLAAVCAGYAREARERLRPREFSLYVGVPFCPTRCAYCSFVSAAVEKSGKLIEPYAAALASEMEQIGELTRSLGLCVRTVYWGGGTPTTLSAAQLEMLMKKLKSSFDLSRVTEYTVEAGRPDTLTEEKLTVLLEGGAGRISINPQTLDDNVLKTIGRAHTADDFFRAFELAVRAGFMHINTDLIAGLPGDTPQGFSQTLETVLNLRPDNITVHTLARKKGSRLTLGGEAPSGEAARENAGEMLDFSRAALRKNGYEPYYLYRQKFMAGGFENVGWTLPGGQCLYNLCMMEELHTVLSVGAGGVSKLVDAGRGRIERVFQCKYPLEYLDRHDKIEAYKNRLAEFASEGVF